MAPFTPMNLFTHLLIYNLAASVLIFGSLAYNPRLWLHRMPPEVRSKVPEKTPQERKLFLRIALPFLFLLFGYPIVYVLQTQEDLLTNYLTLAAFFAGFALWDTLVLDILIFCQLTPRFVIIKGTSREDYSNRKYHLISGAKGLLMSLVFSGLLAMTIAFLKNMLA
jgi:magnesium-transporting ATPase (P-type)